MPNFAFRKSSYSDPDRECVEVATNVPATVAVRDSPSRAWRVFESSCLGHR